MLLILLGLHLFLLLLLLGFADDIRSASANQSGQHCIVNLSCCHRARKLQSVFSTTHANTEPSEGFRKQLSCAWKRKKLIRLSPPSFAHNSVMVQEAPFSGGSWLFRSITANHAKRPAQVPKDRITGTSRVLSQGAVKQNDLSLSRPSHKHHLKP